MSKTREFFQLFKAEFSEHSCQQLTLSQQESFFHKFQTKPTDLIQSQKSLVFSEDQA